MIIEEPKVTTHQNLRPETTQTAFTIELNATTFQILSRDLYKNPIRAIIRELCCNAIDSHKRAGQTRPFEIHLPTTSEPYLTITDFGTGLSRESMTLLYTSYFSSDKRGTNDEIGGKGLGSKTPLAYTDTFSVTSHYNGMRDDYAIHKNERGLPTLTHAWSAPYVGSNGLSITMAVLAKDVTTFQNEAKTILPWMPYKLSNAFHTIDIPTPEALYEGENFRLIKYCTNPLNRYRAHILMGNVAYPIDLTRFGYGYGVQNVLEGHGLFIEMPIGSLEVTAGRDDLLYSDATLTTLKVILSHAYEWMEKTLQADIQNQPTLFQAQKRLNELAIALNGPHPSAINNLFLRYFDANTNTYTPLNIHNTPSVRLKGKVFHIGQKRKGTSVIVTQAHHLNYSNTVSLHHSTNPVTKRQLLESDLPVNSYLLVSADPVEIAEFYAILDADEDDVSDDFPVVPKAARTKRAPVAKTHRILHHSQEIERHGPPPDDALILEKRFTAYTITGDDNNPFNGINGLYNYLHATIENCPTIVVVSPSTPKYAHPKNGRLVRDALREALVQKYRNLTQARADFYIGMKYLHDRGIQSRHFVPPYFKYDLEILKTWNLAPIDPSTLTQTRAIHTLDTLINLLEMPK